jgi:hypothetical protein
VRSYCERLGTGPAAEPLNALSNLAFVWTFARAWRRVRRARAGGHAAWDVTATAVLMGMVAVGSSLWHTLAAPWTELADTLPITLLMVLMLEALLRRVFGLRLLPRAAALLLLLVASVGLPVLAGPGLLGGSTFYLPAWAALGLLALAAGSHREARPALLAAWALFTVSLALRTADLPLCGLLPLGTHFVWHVLNAVLLDRLHGLLAERAAASADSKH